MNQEYILELVSWQEVNGYSTVGLVKEFFNCRQATIFDDGDVMIADPQSEHILSEEELSRFVAWAKNNDPRYKKLTFEG